MPRRAGSFLDPRSTWEDPDAYDRAAQQLASMFAANFATYADGVSDEIRAAGPVVGDTQARARAVGPRRGLTLGS